MAGHHTRTNSGEKAQRGCMSVMFAIPKTWCLLGVLGGAAFLLGCRPDYDDTELCEKKPSTPENCIEDGTKGAVVVRWRMADVSLQRLLQRGQCCCNPNPSRNGEDRKQCGEFGTSCLDAPAWLVENVRLTLTSDSTNPTPKRYVFDIPCLDGEFTTPYCIEPELFDMQLTADYNVRAKAGDPRFICGTKKAASPPSVKRKVVKGQSTNLDAIILGVNSP